MRILHIVGSISPAAGGPTEAIRMLIAHQPPGFTSEVVTLNDPAEPFLKTFQFKITALGSARTSWYVPALTRWLRENRGRFDAAIVHGLWEYTGVAARSALHGHIPYVVFTHGMLDPYFKRAFPMKHRKKWLYWQLAEFRILRDATRVLFTTEVEEKLAHKTFRRWRWKAMITALGTDPPPADTEKTLAAFHERLPELRGKRFLLFLGRIDPKKGCDLLIDAFGDHAANAKTSDLQLMMAGPDSCGWKSELETRVRIADIEDRVHWPGMLQGDLKWGALAACEAFVLTSHQENFGIAVVEALACGKPVLISEPINIAQDIAADGAGLVEADTLDGAVRLLERWTALSPQHRATMSEQARKTFATRYDMRRNTEQILRVFEHAEERH